MTAQPYSFRVSVYPNTVSFYSGHWDFAQEEAFLYLEVLAQAVVKFPGRMIFIERVK